MLKCQPKTLAYLASFNDRKNCISLALVVRVLKTFSFSSPTNKNLIFIAFKENTYQNALITSFKYLRTHKLKNGMKLLS